MGFDQAWLGALHQDAADERGRQGAKRRRNTTGISFRIGLIAHLLVEIKSKRDGRVRSLSLMLYYRKITLSFVVGISGMVLACSIRCYANSQAS